MKKIVALLLLSCFIFCQISQRVEVARPENRVIQGAWNNFDFSVPASYWSLTAKKVGGEEGFVDMVAALARADGLVALPFPTENKGDLLSVSDVDLIEPFLEEFEYQGVKVILSIQPLKVYIPELISILISRYGHYRNIIGVNIDLEWKKSGVEKHVSDEERDEWIEALKEKRSDLKLFLTYFGTLENFPNDDPNLVVLFDGQNDTQTNLLSRYKEIAEKYGSVGIYTGYFTSNPASASIEEIMYAAPNTKYIIHVNTMSLGKPTIVFEMDNIQNGWLESTALKLIDIHMQMNMPVVLGVIPFNLTNPTAGTGLLPKHLKNLYTNYNKIFEIGQQGFSNDPSFLLKNRSREEQEKLILEGNRIITSIGVVPYTFIPPQGYVDKTTVSIVEEIGFEVLSNPYETLYSKKILILESFISLLENVDNNTVIKTPEKLMAEISNVTGRGIVVISYDVNDFEQKTKEKIDQFTYLLDILNKSGKYIFMTPMQYKNALRERIGYDIHQDQKNWIILIKKYIYIIILIAIMVIILIYKYKNNILHK